MTEDESSESTIQPARPTSSKIGRAVVRWGRLCCIGAALALAVGEIAGGYWPFVLLTPPTPQWAAIGILGVLMLAIATAKQKTSIDRVCIVLGLAAFMYGGAITFGRVPWRTVPPAEKVVTTDANLGRVKVMIANVHTENPDHQTILKVIAEEDPDIVLLPEVNDVWVRDIVALNEKYPIHTSMPDSLGNFGMAFYSRLPGTTEWFTAKDSGQDDAYAVPQIHARLHLTDAGGADHDFQFLGLHPLPPIKPGNAMARDALLREVSHTASSGAPAIVAGDFNATRYCKVMQAMAHPEGYGGLSDAASPLRFSWPNTWSWWAMGIRIDHIVATHNWHVVDVHTGPDIGSDHMPIVATLQLVREQK